jgi:hypothetical protein
MCDGNTKRREERMLTSANHLRGCKLGKEDDIIAAL